MKREMRTLRKIMFLLVSIFFLSSTSFAKETISLNEVLDKIENNRDSYENKLYRNNKQKIKKLILENRLGNFNGINISSNFLKMSTFIENRDRISGKNLQNKISYGPLFLNYNYRDDTNNYISYGVEKNIKEIFYSPYKLNLKINHLDDKINKLEYIENTNIKKIDFINIYADLIDTKDEINYRENAKKYYHEEIRKIESLYKAGMEAKISLEASQVELDEINYNLEILNKKINSLYEIIKNKYGLTLSDKSFQRIPYDKKFNYYIKTYKKLNLEKINLIVDIQKEKEKYGKYNNFMPDIIFSFERIDKNKNYGAMYKSQNIYSIRFSKKLFSVDSDYENLKFDKENSIEKLKEEEIKIKNEKIELLLEYENLQKILKISEKKLEISNKKYKIKQKKYQLDRLSYLDVIDAYNEYLAKEIETKKARNNLNAFIYKVAVQSGYEVNKESE